MKWFIKVLKHYADFSGRAQRKEYWMFILFGVIFMFAWTLLLTLLFTINDSFKLYGIVYNVALSSVAILLLPGMAVTVRRLHDTGRSGWMLLVGLIPLIGKIWLITLMLDDGQQGENKYGINPKELPESSPETFTNREKLKSAGITLAVSSAFALLIKVLLITELPFSRIFFDMFLTGLILTAGIMLSGSWKCEKTRPALTVILIAHGIIYVRGILRWVIFSNDTFIFNLIFELSIILCIIVLLFRAQNRKLVRCATLMVIVLACIPLWYNVSILRYLYSMGIVRDMMNLFVMMSSPMAYVLLAWAFLPEKE